MLKEPLRGRLSQQQNATSSARRLLSLSSCTSNKELFSGEIPVEGNIGSDQAQEKEGHLPLANLPSTIRKDSTPSLRLLSQAVPLLIGQAASNFFFNGKLQGN